MAEWRNEKMTTDPQPPAIQNSAIPPFAHSSIPPTVKGLALVSLFNDFASEMVYPLLPAYVVGTLGGTAATLGALDGAADLTAAVTKWISGRLADRRGWQKPLILLGYASAILVRPLMAIASAAWQVVGFRVLDRVGKGLRTPPRDALIAEITPREVQGRAFGLHRAADHFGSIPGSLLAWWLLSQAVDVRKVLQWSAVPGIVAMLVLIVTLRRTPRREPVPGPASPADATGHTFWAPVLALAALVLCRLPETLLLLRLQDVGVPVAMIPLVWAGLHVVRTASSYPGGWLTDRIGQRSLVATGGLLFAAGAFAMGLNVGVGPAVTAFLTLGLVAGLTESAERALVSRLAPRRTGRGFGAYHAVTGFAALPAAVGFGELYQHAGPPVALWVSAATMIVAVLFWLTVPQPRTSI
jgi:MFS family permease